ncbi:MAG: hypothetical protein WCW31_05045 [Patescibacteria group bacterium]
MDVPLETMVAEGPLAPGTRLTGCARLPCGPLLPPAVRRRSFSRRSALSSFTRRASEALESETVISG